MIIALKCSGLKENMNHYDQIISKDDFLSTIKSRGNLKRCDIVYNRKSLSPDDEYAAIFWGTFSQNREL